MVVLFSLEVLNESWGQLCIFPLKAAPVKPALEKLDNAQANGSLSDQTFFFFFFFAVSIHTGCIHSIFSVHYPIWDASLITSDCVALLQAYRSTLKTTSTRDLRKLQAHSRCIHEHLGVVKPDSIAFMYCNCWYQLTGTWVDVIHFIHEPSSWVWVQPGCCC